MAEEPQLPAAGKISEEELMSSMAGSAVYSTRVLVHVGPVVRLTFVEVVGAKKTALYRAAVALPHETAVSLANILKEKLAEIEAELAAAKAAALSGAAETDG